MPGESFLSPEDIAELHAIYDDGMATVQAFSRPAPIVQFRAMNEVTGRMEDVGDPVELISITFGLREGTVTPTPQLTQDFTDGDILLWADSATIPKPGYRFTWQGQSIQVERVYPEDQGTITAEVRLQQVAP